MKDVRNSASEAQNNWRKARYDLIVLLDEIYCIVLKDRTLEIRENQRAKNLHMYLENCTGKLSK